MLNSVDLMGRLTAEPELRTTNNDIAVVSFRIAVERDFKNSIGKKEADFINITAWRQTAEFASNYFTKGMLVAVKGSIQTQSYTDKEGNNRTSFEVVADRLYFAEGKRPNSTLSDNESPFPVKIEGTDCFADDDDDLPF